MNHLESKGGRQGITLPIAAFTVIVLVIAATVAVSSYLASPSETAKAEESGPISSYPFSWVTSCRPLPSGNATTEDQLTDAFLPGVANFSLSDIYSTILSSASFRAASTGHGWVTIYWGTQQITGPNESTTYVVAQFVLLNGNQSAGRIQVEYDLASHAVTVEGAPGFSSCPPGPPASATSMDLSNGKPSYYAAGEPIKIIFSIINYRIPSIKVVSRDSCIGNFTILQGFGTTGPVVYNSTLHGGCTGAPINIALGPGQSYNQTLQWNQIYDNGMPVPPGTYEVMGRIATDLENYSEPIGVVYLGSPVAFDSSTFGTKFYFEAHVDQAFYPQGEPIRIVGFIANQGDAIYNVHTTNCAFKYSILNLTNFVVYSYAAHTTCSSVFTTNPIPPSGGISQVFHWNQTNDQGEAVPPGFYRALVSVAVSNGTHSFIKSEAGDFEIGVSSNPHGHIVSLMSSSLCPTGCGKFPSLIGGLFANGNLKTLKVYLNGTLIATQHYNLPCCYFSYPISLNLPIENSTVHVMTGWAYDMVLVATFSDGEVSISWATPLNPTAF